MLVVHQRLPLAGFHANVGELVVGIDLQFNGFASGQRHRAFGSHDQALVAHLGGQQCDVAFELGAQLAFVDHAALSAVAVENEFARHEALVAYAVGGGNEAAHIHHAATAKEYAVAVANDHLARRGDAAQNGAGLGARHAVKGGAACVVEVHMGIFAHVEALPVDHSALASLVDDHVRTAAADGGAASGHAAASGQDGVGHRLGECGSRSGECAKHQCQRAGQRFGNPNSLDWTCYRCCAQALALSLAARRHNF